MVAYDKKKLSDTGICYKRRSKIVKPYSKTEKLNRYFFARKKVIMFIFSDEKRKDVYLFLTKRNDF